MPSSITLTVSHLPTSTSFFLSALQPLDYVFRGRSNNTIGFGSATNPSQPPDFWITQEVPGVPAGAAHVAFPASSHKKVQHFFTAALKAGGTIHGEPAVRDSTGYYSAAIIDFDGNSIEAVYRPFYSDDKENESVNSTVSKSAVARSTVSKSAPPRSLAPSKSEVGSVKSFRDRAQEKAVSGDVLDNILSEVRSAADLARKALQGARPSPTTFRSEPSVGSNNKSDDSNAVIGTLLGVAAGAALTYAFRSKSKDDESLPPPGDSRRRPLLLDRATSPYESRSIASEYRRGSYPAENYTRAEETEYRSLASRPSRARRNSTSVIPSMLEEDRASRASRRSSSRSRFEPIRMIEAPPSVNPYRSSSRSRTSDGSKVSTVKPPKQPSIASTSKSSKSTKSSRSSAYPPSSFPGNLPTPPPSVSTVRKHPLPPSSSTIYTTPSRKERSQSRSSKTRRPEEYPLPASRIGSTHTATVIGDSRGRRGSVMDEEVRPEDSISQVSFGSKRSSRSRR